MAKITTLKNGLLSTKVYVGNDIFGKPVQKRISAATPKELDTLILKAKYEYQSEIAIRDTLTLRKAYDDYISLRENVLSKGTIRLYRSYEKYTFQSLMDMHIDSITKEMIQKEVNKMAAVDTPKTIRNKYGLLSAVLREYSEHRGYNIKLPTKRKPKLKIPTQDDVKKVLELVEGTDMEIPIMFASYCGMRRGEIFALTYNDIDMERERVSVTKALGINEYAKYEIKAPKSFAGYREIDIPKVLMEKILVNMDCGKPLIALTIPQFEYQFDKLKKEYDIQFRFHDLRHYYASILVTLDVPDIYAMRLLGHSTVNFLRQNYQHTYDKQLDQYRDKIKHLI